MSTYVLIPGAGSDSWYWHLVVPELRARGQDASDVVLVAQSLGGFTAPLVCERVPVRLMVLVAPMVPKPGELLGDWWENTRWEESRREEAESNGTAPVGFDDLEALLFHDLPPDVKAEAMHHERNQSGTPMGERWPLAAWPDVPTRVVLCREDRVFPPGFQRRVAEERLGVTPDEIDRGHLPALSRPKELADVLERLRDAVAA